MEPSLSLLAWVFRHAELLDPFPLLASVRAEILPHQVEAVYGHMLRKRPLRLLLADDPGAGKTVMTGLYLREARLRGLISRALVVAPGGLVNQWLWEMEARFGLPFRPLNGEVLRAEGPKEELLAHPLWVARLDVLARSLEGGLGALALEGGWDLVVFDEAHRLSATLEGEEVRRTRRYRLGEALAQRSPNLLLLTATPHRGKTADFLLLLRLLSQEDFPSLEEPPPRALLERFLLRRLKEDLVRLDGSRLFPERASRTLAYPLEGEELALYKRVTEYVLLGMGRAEGLPKDQRNAVGFALTLIQRRLASSPLALYRTLRRRREALERALEAGRLPRPLQDLEALEDEEDYPAQDEDTPLAEATPARSLEELREEVAWLAFLERQAYRLYRSGLDRKWREFGRFLQEVRRGEALLVFTEYRDTLEYLEERLQGLGVAYASVHGGLSPKEREAALARLRQRVGTGETFVLLATDAAGEGLNLQEARLVVNYDLPWNPVRLEQRFGRVHRIGQKKRCEMWNLLAENTREGRVFQVLFEKLERAEEELGGKVFDVLGELFRDRPLSSLLWRALEGEEPPIELPQERLSALSGRELAQRVALEEVAHRLQAWEEVRLVPERAEALLRKGVEALGGRAVEVGEGVFHLFGLPLALRSLLREGRVSFRPERAGEGVELLAPDHPFVQTLAGRLHPEGPLEGIFLGREVGEPCVLVGFWMPEGVRARCLLASGEEREAEAGRLWALEGPLSGEELPAHLQETWAKAPGLEPHLPLAFRVAVLPPEEEELEGFASVEEKRRMERLAVRAVLLLERRWGHEAREMPPGNPGFDVESRLPDGSLRRIEVKGKARRSRVVRVSRTQILRSLEDPSWLLAVVQPGGEGVEVFYLRGLWPGEPPPKSVGHVEFLAGEILPRALWRGVVPWGELGHKPEE